MSEFDVPRERLTILLNALYDDGVTTLSVAHPSDAVGELCRLHLADDGRCTVDVTLGVDAYADRRNDVNTEYGEPAVTELPDRRSYLAAYLAAGLLGPANGDDVAAFLDRYGSPDLTAGHRPVLAAFDTNLLPWEPATMLDLEPTADGIINGFALATGVREELDWEQKRSDTRSLVEAFGEPFEALWNQPAGPQRQGRLGETHYRRLRDRQAADEIATERGDEAIVAGLDRYQDDQRKDILLFSNDRDFVERARAHRVLAQRVTFPETLPSELDGTWEQARDLVYVLAVLCGVLEVPKTTLYGVWQGKSGQAWHDERLRIDVRSPNVRPVVERDLRIVEAYHDD